MKQETRTYVDILMSTVQDEDMHLRPLCKEHCSISDACSTLKPRICHDMS